MSSTGGELLVEALLAAGVTTAFGVPGESFMGVLDAMYDRPINFISTRHEGGGSFMASGYAKMSLQIGVCFGTRAVGTANMAIGVHNARQDSAPMIAIAGQVERPIKGREAFQEVDLVAAMTPVCKWAVEIPDAHRVPELMSRAVHLARHGRPGPVFVAIPADVCDELSDAPPAAPPAWAAPAPDAAALSRALEALLAARAPLIFAGGGVYGAIDQLIRFAEATEVPVITSWRHHDGFPNQHRLFLGSASLGAPASVWARLADADVILVIGNRLQENSTRGYTVPGPDARLFQVDIDAAVLGNYPAPELGIQGDAGAALTALIGLVRRLVPGLDERRAGNDADRRRFEEATSLPASSANRSDSGSRAGSVDYPCVIRTLTDVLPETAIVASDAGNFYGWLSRYFRFRRPRTYLGPASGAMGYGLPAAIGAKIARPDLPVVSVSGDGGFLMTMAELETAVRYEVPVVAMVLDNQRHGTIRMHQVLAHPGRVVGTDLSTPDLATVARAFGAEGWSVQENSELEPALRKAMTAGRPAVIHVAMDPDQLSVDRLLPS
jgi:acetolactate synthase-1/2/3 large subunit